VVIVTRNFWVHLDVGSTTGDFHPIRSRPCWAYTIIRLQRTDERYRASFQSYLPPLTLAVGRLNSSTWASPQSHLLWVKVERMTPDNPRFGVSMMKHHLIKIDWGA
jgi:hypothetical protein